MPAAIPIVAGAAASAAGAGAVGTMAATAAGGLVANAMSDDDSGTSAPDPYATSAAQTQADTEIARLNATLNRYNQVTPWGNLTWTKNGDNWTSTVSLSPQQQAILEANQGGILGTSQLYNQFLNANSSSLGGYTDPLTAIPYSNDATRKAVEDALYQRSTSRLDPQFEQRQNALDSQLLNSGFQRGTEAWDTEQQNLGRERTDAYQSARDSAILAGGQEESRQNALQWTNRTNELNEQYGQDNQILNILASLRNGTTLQQPQFQSTNTSVNIPSSNLSSNIWNSYNAQLANQNAQTNSNNQMMNGLFQLGAAYLGNSGSGSSGSGWFS